MVDAVKEFESLYVRPAAGRTLIAGSFVTDGKEDRRVRYKNVLGVDMRSGPGVDVVMDLEKPDRDIGRFSHIECLSVLEHSKRPWLMAKTLEGMLVRGGTIHIEVPFMWRMHSHPDDYFRMSASALRDSLFTGIEWAQLLYATHGGLIKKALIPWTMHEGHRYYARSVTCGFGRKR